MGAAITVKEAVSDEALSDVVTPHGRANMTSIERHIPRYVLYHGRFFLLRERENTADRRNPDKAQHT